MNFKLDLVSILIPNYNKAEFLSKTLDSILSQEYPHWECIVVDDQSTDGSFEILEKYAEKDQRIKVLRRPDHLPKGANFCRNHAFSLSQGEFIQWFDSDDLMYPWFLSKKVSYLQSHPETAFVVSKGDIQFDHDFEGNKKFIQCLESENPIEDYLRFRLIFLTGGPLLRRGLLEKAGLFNPNLNRHQEWELYLRIVLNNPDWGIIQEPCFKYFFHRNSITSKFQNKKKVLESELMLFQQVLNLPVRNFRNQIPKITRMGLAFRYGLLAFYYLKIRFSFQYLQTLLKETVTT